jgi:hypothetical protein
MRILKIALISGLALMAPGLLATSTVEKIKTSVYDMLNKDSTVIEFDQGSANLSEDNKTTLRATVRAVEKDTNIDQILVVAWADEALPAGKHELNAASKALATDRNTAVAKALEAAGAKNIKKFTMTEKPNWLQEVFATETDQIKRAAAGKHVSNRSDQQLGKVLEEKGGPGKVVVIVKREISSSLAE